MPDPVKLLALLRRAAMLFRNGPGRRGAVVPLPASAVDALVVGDLHGNIPFFRKILDVAALAQHPARHLVLQELVHGTRSYPNDGGDKSHQLVDLVAALKCQYPDRVHLIMGNHELSELTGRVIAKNGEVLNKNFRQGITTAYGEYADAIYAAYLELFASLPLAVRAPNRVFISHTLPDERDFDRINWALLDADAWPEDELKRGGSIYALTWGRDTSPANADRYAAQVDADLFINGHQPCDEGVQQPNHRQIIIDGTDPYPAYLLFSTQTPATIESLRAAVRIIPAA